MKIESLKELLEQVKVGELAVEGALEKLRHLPFEPVGADHFAHIDHHRHLRCGMPEVIYCPGKTTEQVVEIFGRLAETGNNVLATRAGRCGVGLQQARGPAVGQEPGVPQRSGREGGEDRRDPALRVEDEAKGE